MILQQEKSYWEKKKAVNTATEINQQPAVWKKTIKLLKDSMDKHQKFFNVLLKKKPKFILVGAGTSEFVGNSIYPFLRSKGYDVESIPTTNIVSNPHEYFDVNRPTCFISFARSGNSPESVATVNLGKQLLKNNFHHIIITCNDKGKLATNEHTKQELLIVLPPETNDLGFAMTSSYSSMLITALLMFTKNKKEFDEVVKSLNEVVSGVEKITTHMVPTIGKLVSPKTKRIVFLGSGNLLGYAQESHLKCLELNAGVIPTFFNSPMGFRHGPKSIVNNETLTFIYLPTDAYTRKYALDLLNEMKSDKIAYDFVVLDTKNDAKLAKENKNYFSLTKKAVSDVFAGLAYVVVAQIFALLSSIGVNNLPDTPSKSGQVNRVVKGVTIYKLTK
ncbi:SIS domain-containing protein [[Mycoplasma] testudinis]|uniref:SIS domain-containing protein n=1 Tax=[Mycoplasma] testudinis TaxID=33924 RepID=UPI0004813CEF|nr:SIS domain-containing protein [[Mycoplasma] testudinis]